MVGQPEAEACDGPGTGPLARRRAVPVGGAEHGEDAQRGEDRQDDVHRQHRRPGDVERQDDEEERGCDGRRTAPQVGGEEIDRDDPEHVEDQDRHDESAFGEPEHAAGDGRRKPPREAVGVRARPDLSVVHEGIDIGAEEHVVAQAEAAEVEEPEDQADRGDGDDERDVCRLQQGAVRSRCPGCHLRACDASTK